MENVNWGPSIFMFENVDAVVAYLRENFPSDGILLEILRVYVNDSYDAN